MSQRNKKGDCVTCDRKGVELGSQVGGECSRCYQYKRRTGKTWTPVVRRGFDPNRPPAEPKPQKPEKAPMSLRPSPAYVPPPRGPVVEVEGADGERATVKLDGRVVGQVERVETRKQGRKAPGGEEWSGKGPPRWRVVGRAKEFQSAEAAGRALAYGHPV